ncbi:hypothetical protein BT93_H0901 [Corymbia citriodora subsp. variegata]|nr:hypothetical protein BT93_H0901 [Corymbia citriodora subsp. variegata]
MKSLSIFFLVLFLLLSFGNEVTMVTAADFCIQSFDLGKLCVLAECQALCTQKLGPNATGACITLSTCNCRYPC